MYFTNSVNRLSLGISAIYYNNYIIKLLELLILQIY